MDTKLALKKAKRLMSRHPNNIPVIIITDMKMNIVHFLPSKTSSLGEFMTCVRDYTSLKSSEALLVFIEDIMPPLTATMGDLYIQYATPDGYLHVKLSKENTFG